MYMIECSNVIVFFFFFKIKRRKNIDPIYATAWKMRWAYLIFLLLILCLRLAFLKPASVKINQIWNLNKKHHVYPNQFWNVTFPPNVWERTNMICCTFLLPLKMALLQINLSSTKSHKMAAFSWANHMNLFRMYAVTLFLSLLKKKYAWKPQSISNYLWVQNNGNVSQIMQNIKLFLNTGF